MKWHRLHPTTGAAFVVTAASTVCVRVAPALLDRQLPQLKTQPKVDLSIVAQVQAPTTAVSTTIMAGTAVIDEISTTAAVRLRTTDMSITKTRTLETVTVIAITLIMTTTVAIAVGQGATAEVENASVAGIVEGIGKIEIARKTVVTTTTIVVEAAGRGARAEEKIGKEIEIASATTENELGTGTDRPEIAKGTVAVIV